MIKHFFILLTLILLNSCSKHNRDLVHYMNDIKNRPAPPLVPIPQFRLLPDFQFPTHEYKRNPFRSLDEGKKTDQFVFRQEKQIDLLESLVLEDLQFVGILKQGTKVWALINIPDKEVVPIRVGYYIGRHAWRVIAIKNDAITVQEARAEQSSSHLKTKVLFLQGTHTGV